MSFPYAKQSVLSEIKLLKHKMKNRGYPVKVFFRKGNGIKTLLNETGRFYDFKGLFVFSTNDHSHSFVKESDTVLQDIQKTVRGDRAQDREFL